MPSGSQVAVNWSDSGNAALSVVYILCNRVASLHRPWSLLTAGHFKPRSTFCLGKDHNMIPIFRSCDTTELPAIVSSLPWHDVTSFVKFHLCNRAPRLFHYLQISVLPAPKQRGGALFTQYIQETAAGKCAGAAGVTQTDALITSSAFNPWLEINLQRLQGGLKSIRQSQNYCCHN